MVFQTKKGKIKEIKIKNLNLIKNNRKKYYF